MKLYMKTPLIDMLNISNQDHSFKVKMEAYQPSGSFKLRGMDTLCRYAIAHGATHLVSSSGGNAGLSAAYVGRKLGVKVTVVVPSTTASFILDRLRLEGAEAIVHGDVWDEADKYALDLASKPDAAYIPPFDNEKLWEGHSTLVDELKEQCSEQPDMIILSVGGGGLMCGVMQGLIRNGWTDTTILAVETEGSALLYAAYKANKLVTIDGINTIATSLGAKRVSATALEYVQKYKIIPYTVNDTSTAHACIRFANEYRTLIEPACGASVSVAYDQPDIIKKYKNIIVVACGGAIVNLDKIDGWKKQFE